jgi:5-methyltetrahydrofolate--homocysteine methyltransferase
VLARWRPAPLPETTVSMPSPAPAVTRRSTQVRSDSPIPPVPSLDRKLELIQQIDEVWRYINPYMLYGRHLGYRGNFDRDVREGNMKALRLRDQIESLKLEAAEFVQAAAVWQFFEAERDGNSIRLFSPGGATSIHTFRFDRQPACHQRDGLCLSDFVLEPSDGLRDHVAILVVTAGAGIRERAEEWKQSGDLFKAHAIQALALETAEACAEWLHHRIRDEWGFPDGPALSMQDRFTSKYRGKRYSFGYPACPNLDDQQGIWKLLRPEEIGVGLTDGMMMDPEASVSALVFHHPDCVYFAVPAPC